MYQYSYKTILEHRKKIEKQKVLLDACPESKFMFTYVTMFRSKLFHQHMPPTIIRVYDCCTRC